MVDVGPEIEFLLRVLDGRYADTNAVYLAEVQALRVVVVVLEAPVDEHARRKVFVVLKVGMEDVGLCNRVGSGWVGLRDGRLGKLAIRLKEVECGAGTGRQKGNCGDGAYQGNARR